MSIKNPCIWSYLAGCLAEVIGGLQVIVENDYLVRINFPAFV
ncbi:hypothetical protein PROPEN_04279 [Proteus penneri ATCC 35198]|nr:hypothetical protein PROPEN_04279 [Proteus penneri ATCC 35198]